MSSTTTPAVLTDLPLFPLGSVLFPGGLLPLRVFEVRYLDMIGKAHRAGTPFGVVCLTHGAEVRVAGAQAEQFASVGTLARIETFASPQPGLQQIECIGTERFRVQRSALQKNGLWTATVEVLPDDLSVAVPDDLAHTAIALRRVVQTLQERLQAERASQTQEVEGTAGMRLPLAEPWHFDDCGWVANRWCEFLPVQSELKQRLMELDSPLMRLELVSDVLARTGIA